MSKKKAQKLIMAGERSPLNETNPNKSDPAIQAIVKAMNMCWIHSPEKRATARAVERFLDSALSKLGVHGRPP